MIIPMEYGIAATITVVFMIVYVIFKKKEREHFTVKLDDENYLKKLNDVSKSLGLPSSGCKKEYAVKKFLRCTKYAMFISKKHKNDEDFNFFTKFYDIIDDNKKIIKNLAKLDYSKIADLPAIKNVARIEIVARILLESNNYILIEDKIESCFKIFNNENTISFPEFENFNLMIKFLLLEKLYFVANRVVALEKLLKFAKKVAKNPNNYTENKLYKELNNNNVFLYFTSNFLQQTCSGANFVYFDVIQNIIYTTSTIFDMLKIVEEFNFDKYYSPISILESYESFSCANKKVQNAFLNELSSQATKLNMDEYAYTLALQKFCDREEHRYTVSKQIDFAGFKFRFIWQKGNLKLLANALSSLFAMNFYFVQQPKRFPRNNVFENTLLRKSGINPLKLGLLLSNGKISINSSLPFGVESVDMILNENGVFHHLKIVKNDTAEVYCNGTKYDGIPFIKLGDKPLDIVFKTPVKHR